MITAIIVLGIINLALLAFIGYREWSASKERKVMVDALVARSAEEYQNIKLTEKVKIEKPVKADTPPDLVPENELTDEEFRKNLEGGIY